MLLSPETQLLLRRGCTRGWKNLLRERGWGATLLTFFGTALLLQLLVLLLLGAQGAHRLLKAQSDLRLEILPTATKEHVQEFFVMVRHLPYVEGAQFITREQAYEEERKRDAELVSFLEEYALGNPFPDTVRVTLRSLEDYASFARFIRQSEWQQTVDPSFLSVITDQEQQVFALARFARVARSLVLLFLGLLGAIVTGMTFGLVRERALHRSDELLVERFSGAPFLSRVLPFVVEGSVLLAGAVVASLVCTLGFLFLLPFVIPDLGPGGMFVTFHREVVAIVWTALPSLVFLEILVIPLLALLGSVLGIRSVSARLAFA